MATSRVRRPRADAVQNRNAILRAAHETFAAKGILVPMDAIATAAGLGNATLYRYFPTREHLLAAVMEDSVSELLSRSIDFEHDLSVEAALREWLYQLAWGLRIWHDLPNCVATAHGDEASPVQNVTVRLAERTGDFLERYRRGGAADAARITAEDLFQLVTAVSWAIDRFGDDAQQARERISLATAGVFRAR